MYGLILSLNILIVFLINLVLISSMPRIKRVVGSNTDTLLEGSESVVIIGNCHQFITQ